MTDNNAAMTAQPVFLVATERSGSNLTRSILGAHDDISAPHPFETAYPYPFDSVSSPSELSESKSRKLVRDLVIAKQNSVSPNPDYLDPSDVHARVSDGGSLLSVQRAMYEEQADIDGSDYWVSKHGHLLDYLENVLDYYEDPQFVYLVRDARDVVLSFKSSNVGDCHPYYNAQRWREEQAKGRELLESYDGDVHLIRYKDLLQNPEEEVREMCKTLGVEFDEQMLYYYDSDLAKELSEKSKAFENLSSPIKSDNFDKYIDQLPDEEVKITEKIAGEQLEYFGYERVYDDLGDFDLEEDRYEEENEKLNREMSRKYWREKPAEKVRRSSTQSFKYYMVFRYGVMTG